MSKSWIGDVAAAALALTMVTGGFYALRAIPTTARPALPAMQPRLLRDASHFSREGHLLGVAEAPIKIVEFSDFECPFCRRMQRTLRLVRGEYPSSVAVVLRHYPLAGHANALAAAIAAECAAAEGKFERFADLLFEKQDSLGLITWEDAAARSGVADTIAFARCRRGTTARMRVDADIAAGLEIGIAGTPTLIIGDRVHVGVLPRDSLLALLRAVNGDQPLR